MPENVDEFLSKKPKYAQSDSGKGPMKALVVDVRDPWRRGRVRAWAYPTDGDLPELDIYSIDWAEPKFPRAGFTPPELGDRVWLDYESDDHEKPIYYGTWNAAPYGHGTLPWNKRKGCELRSEAWHNHDLYPESTIVGASRNGNVIHMVDAYMSEKDMAALISLQDISGRFFRIWSIKEDSKIWSPKIEFEEGAGSLYNGDIGENECERNGYESLDDDEREECLGAIESGYSAISTSMVGGKDGFTLAQSYQKEDGKDGDITRVERSVGGNVYSNNLKGAMLGMANDALFLLGSGGIFGDVVMPPRRWD